MARLDCDCERTAGVTLVALTLTSDATEEVRVDVAHDGPVWPPRRQGVPEAGWDEDGWTGTVGPDDPVVLGYATPAEVADRPATVDVAGPAGGGDVSAPTPRELVRTLGDARPPRDAVPEPDTSSVGNSQTASATSQPTAGEVSAPASQAMSSVEAAAARLDQAERLAGASSVEEATAAVREAGGIEAVRALAEQVAADRQRLASRAERSRRLADRAAAVEIPVETLERVT
ncbi:hypothetical protein ACKVMT_09860 [Halobacteriales archaeon Cl-PHB]